MAKLYKGGAFQLLDSNGDPVSGGKLQFDEAGTSTPATVYTDNALSVAHTNPVIADSAGRFAPIYLQAIDYKVTVKDANDAVIDTIDPEHGVSAENTIKINEVNLFTKTQQWAQGADVAAAATLTLGDDGNSFDITGSGVTITSIATKTDAQGGGLGTWVKLQFDGANTLQYNATDIVLPAAQDITTAAGDIAIFYEYALGDWRLSNYIEAAKAVGAPPRAKSPGAISNGTDADHEIDIDAGTWLALDADNAITLAATTIDIEDTGNGGRLDSETLDVDTWYAVLSGRNTSDGALVAGFKKTNAKPTDWDFYRHHGWVRTDSSSNIKPFIQVVDKFYYQTQESVITNGSATTSTEIGLTNFIPPDADLFTLHMEQETDDAGGATANLIIEVVSGSEFFRLVSKRINGPGSASQEGGASSSAIEVPVLGGNRRFHYRWSSTFTTREFDAYVAGWQDQRGRDL